MKIFVAILITAVVCYPAGYLTCYFWGKSRKAIAGAADKAGKEIGKVADRIQNQ